MRCYIKLLNESSPSGRTRNISLTSHNPNVIRTWKRAEPGRDCTVVRLAALPVDFNGCCFTNVWSDTVLQIVSARLSWRSVS